MGSHRGTMANDVRGAYSGVKYPYYAPCDCKLIWFDKANGQGMWQSVNKVRFANGNIDYATFVTAHDETFDADKIMGSTIPQGNQLGNMGNKGNSTGVHCHIEIAQHKYDISNWHKNGYGIWCFPDETDTDSCYFVDNTNIIYGMGGDWKYLSQIPVDDKGEKADQILYKGSKVKFDGVFKADILKSPISTNLFGNTKLTGVSYNDYYHERCKDYHWIPLDDWTEVDQGGNSDKQDDIIVGGLSYIKNDNVYTVEEIDIPTNSAKLILNGHPVWVFSTYLYEVSDY